MFATYGDTESRLCKTNSVQEHYLISNVNNDYITYRNIQMANNRVLLHVAYLNCRIVAIYYNIVPFIYHQKILTSI